VHGLEEEYGEKVEFRYIDADDYDTYNAYARRYGVQYLPTVIVIDAAGEIILEESGIAGQSAYRDKLEAALAEASR